MICIESRRRAVKLPVVKKPRVSAAPPDDFGWLAQVREVREPLKTTRPIRVRIYDIPSGAPVPQPTAPYPERHPYCEFNFRFKGRATQFIGTEKIGRDGGDLMLLGPGTPHRALHLSFPQRSITVHFLPILLFEMGPEGDGARLLARFTAPQKIGDRVVRLPGALRKRIAARMEEMIAEFEQRRQGCEFRLRSLLLDSLVDFTRWEESAGRHPESLPGPADWIVIEKTLRYMQENYAEPLYVKHIARNVGLSGSRLQAIFGEALGMSCVQYLRSLRISHAAALLCRPNARVSEIALEVGFETLSHFNTSFRCLMGMSPTEYIGSVA